MYGGNARDVLTLGCRLLSLAALPDLAFPTPSVARFSAPVTDSVDMCFSFEGLRKWDQAGPGSRRAQPQRGRSSGGRAVIMVVLLV